MKTAILVKSSSGQPYTVEFATVGNRMKVTCLCPAGGSRQFCKHRLSLMQGQLDLLIDPSQARELNLIVVSPEYRKLQDRLDHYLQSLAEIEAEKIRIATAEKNLKCKFAKDVAVGV